MKPVNGEFGMMQNKIIAWTLALAIAAPSIVVGSPSTRLEFSMQRGANIKHRAAVVEIGDSTAVDFQPEFKVSLWGGESTFKVKLRSPDRAFTNHTRTTPMRNGKRSARLSTALTVHDMYALNDNAFEWEFILNAKPARNVWRFPMESQGLDFFFQDSLHDSLIGKAFRPDSVTFSYAVYHKTRRWNKRIINGADTTYENYGTGKAFHIYRPKAWDAAGDTTWCRLFIDTVNGFLRLRVPQRFLDNATYPVTIDPTVGYDVAGGTEWVWSGTTSLSAFNNWNHDVVETGAGTLDSARVYGRVNGTIDIQQAMLGLYAKTGTLSTSTLLSGSKTTIDIDGNSAAWWATTASGTLIASTDYIVSIIGQDNLGASRCRMNYDSGTWDYIKTATESTFDLPADLTGYAASSRRFSAVFIYTEDGGGGGTIPKRKRRTQTTRAALMPEVMTEFGFAYQGGGQWTAEFNSYDVDHVNLWPSDGTIFLTVNDAPDTAHLAVNKLSPDVMNRFGFTYNGTGHWSFDVDMYDVDHQAQWNSQEQIALNIHHQLDAFDVDGNGRVQVSDIFGIVGYIFQGKSPVETFNIITTESE